MDEFEISPGRHLGNAQGAFLIMRHFPYNSSGLLEKHATDMATKIKEYWKQVGIEKPQIAICTQEKRTQETAKTLGFSEDDMLIGPWFEASEITLESIFNRIAPNDPDKVYQSAVYIGHAPQVAKLWQQLNQRKASPLEGNGYSQDHSQRRRLSQKDFSIKAYNAYSYVPSCMVNDNGALYWAGHNQVSLQVAFDEKAFIDGESFVPGFAPPESRMQGLLKLTDNVLGAFRESKREDRPRLRQIDRVSIIISPHAM